MDNLTSNGVDRNFNTSNIAIEGVRDIFSKDSSIQWRRLKQIAWLCPNPASRKLAKFVGPAPPSLNPVREPLTVFNFKISNIDHSGY